ncbi:MAG: nucleotidyl transferase AbiEii/AbiGii toxin family protein [Oscillospiraceae bacterium]|nr:nucleotidyl transferase AbiEii/AbiGii toxin family protein [Oscillospiraceae bacterium]
MISKNPMQLKALIRNKAKENNISAQLVMQNYMMERLLERISLSEYKYNFILKGGFLIAAIVGLDTRATMDLDTTLKNYPLTHESISMIFENICTIAVEDDVMFKVERITDIREVNDYQGLRVHLTANYPPLAVPLTVDVTTGDRITPREVEYSFKLMFDERDLSVMAYNLETTLAEKLETVLSRNIANTRPRDFYDIHVLYSLRNFECDTDILRKALNETTQGRGSGNVLTEYRGIIENIRDNPQLLGFWERYRKEFDYAKDIEFVDTCDTILRIMVLIS